LFHLSGFIFGLLLLYFYLSKVSKLNTKFMWAVPFILIVILEGYLSFFGSFFGEYYYNLIQNTSEFRISPRIIIELMFISWGCFYYRKTHFSSHCKLLFIIFLFSSFVEVYFGFAFFNRIRVVVWLLFIYLISTTWKMGILNINFKTFMFIYGILIFSVQAMNNLEHWS